LQKKIFPCIEENKILGENLRNESLPEEERKELGWKWFFKVYEISSNHHHSYYENIPTLSHYHIINLIFGDIRLGSLPMVSLFITLHKILSINLTISFKN
jgi:hypothetical protein